MKASSALKRPKMTSIKTEKMITPTVLCETSTIWACTSFGLTGHCASGGGFGGRFGSGCRLGSSCGISNQDSIGSRNGKEQTGSLPTFCTLLGINLSGKAAKISQLTCSTLNITTSTIRPRRPCVYRNKNLNKFPIGSSWLHRSSVEPSPEAYMSVIGGAGSIARRVTIVRISVASEKRACCTMPFRPTGQKLELSPLSPLLCV